VWYGLCGQRHTQRNIAEVRGSQSASSRYWYDLAGNLSTSIDKNVTNCYYYNVQNKLVKIVGTNFVNEFMEHL